MPPALRKSSRPIFTPSAIGQTAFGRPTFLPPPNSVWLNRLKPLLDVGLGYVKMGQSSSTLSGGESQRVKLASFLAKDNGNSTMFIFDEPTTGLHFNDVRVLLDAFSALVEKGHSLIIIEHNLDVIKCADWVIDLGPEGGEKGGNLLYSGTPEGLMNVAESHTGHYLKKHIYR